MTRKCQSCGWEYPRSYKHARCKFCKEYLDEILCSVCGQVGVPYQKGKLRCKACYNEYERNSPKRRARQKRWAAKKKLQHATQFEDWTAKLKKAKFVALTEKDWLKACSHFNGCALCDNQEIAARGYFIDFKDGGRYTAWNILPMCEKCVTELKRQHNPFLRLDPLINLNLETARGLGKEKTDKAFKYLQERYDEYENESI